MGVSPTQTDAQRIQISEALGPPTVELVEHASLLRAVRDLVVWGRAVVAVLQACVARGGAISDRLSVAGHVAGLWGPPYRWDADRRQLVALFPRSGTPRKPPPKPIQGLP